MKRLLLLASSFMFCFSTAACSGNVVVENTGGNHGGLGGGGNGQTGVTTSSGSLTSTSPIDFAACDGPGQCMLAEPGCCPACGIPELGAFAPINSKYEADYQKYVCPEPTPCPACETIPNPNLFAYCDAGHCVAADVRTHAVSACKSSSDCHLRAGSACCEACGDVSFDSLIAVSGTSGVSLASLVCSPNGDCPDCIPNYPAAVATCADDGHCQVEPGGG